MKKTPLISIKPSTFTLEDINFVIGKEKQDACLKKILHSFIISVNYSRIGEKEMI